MALKLINNNFHRRNKIVNKIFQCYNLWENILFGVPKGSILGPILLNIFRNDHLLIVKHSDDNAIYKAYDNIDDVIIY